MSDLSAFQITKRWPAENPDILRWRAVNACNG